jgi:nondiscriminating glutamyl-tRNA synthetase
METLKDGVELFRLLADNFEVSDESKETLSWESSKNVIENWKKAIDAFNGEYLSEGDFNRIQDGVKDVCQVKGKHLFMPIRVAIIGKPHGAELKQLVPLIPKSQLQKRANAVLSQL